MPEENDSPERRSPEQPSLLGNLPPDEMYARGMQSVKMTTGSGGVWEAPTVDEAARLFPGYEVLRLLGRGGMGAVYQARQIELDRLVAIKLLPLEISVNGEFTDRFRREARAMARLHHPNIITVFDFGKSSDGHLYIVMEFVEGANLSDIIHQVGLDEEQALSVVEQICTALAYAHGKGIVHRDIKPANVMIDVESHVKVADFGLARLVDPGVSALGHTTTGTILGTLEYMAPEQMQGMSVDHRADIYSIGVLLYEMVCRQVPKGIFEPPSQRTGCNARIDQIVIRAMQQAPERRYQSTQDMKADIIAVRTPLPGPVAESNGHPSPEPTVVVAPPSPKPAVMKVIPPPEPKGRLWKVVGGLIALVALVAGAVLLFKSPKVISSDTGSVRNATSGPVSPRGMAAPAPEAASKDAPFVNILGQEYVPVPGTRVLFCRWETRIRDYATYAQDHPSDAAWLKHAKSPSTRDDGEFPIFPVSWEDAQAFCQWLTQKESAAGRLPAGMKYRLPTDEEWSCAAGLAREEGATPAEKNDRNQTAFPWGSGYPPPPRAGNYADAAWHTQFPKEPWIEGYDDGYTFTAPVGSFAPNAYGIYDLGGNVWQWCEDQFEPGKVDRVLRGASWGTSGRENLLSSHRVHGAPGIRSFNDGFRCVLELSAK